MARDASECMLCHLTGLFGDQRDKTYDQWLLDQIEQNKGLAAPPVHFSSFRTFLSLGHIFDNLDEEELKACWQILLQEAANGLSGLQFALQTQAGNHTRSLMEWNQKQGKPFHLLLDLTAPIVHELENQPLAQSYQQLKKLIDLVFAAVKLPVDALRFQQADFLWQENGHAQTIEPRNHYLIRHIRAALDRMNASQALLVQSTGDFEDVKKYFSDGYNEAQLAGSVDIQSALLKALKTGRVESLRSITSQFRLASLETAYFHALELPPKDEPSMLLAWFVIFSCSGVCAMDLPSLLACFLSSADQAENSIAKRMTALFSSPGYDSLSQMLSFRHQQDAFHPLGAQIALQEHPHIWAIARFSPDMSQSILCLANFSTEAQQIILAADELAPGSTWQDFRGNKTFQAARAWHLQPYEYLWLIVK